jgi:hypothetical protein
MCAALLVIAAACGSGSKSAQTTATSPSDQATESTSDTTAPVQTDPTTPTTSAPTFTRTWTLSLQASDGAAYTALYELGDVVPASTGLVNGYEPGNACQVDRQRDAVAPGRMTIRNNSTFTEGLHVDVFMASKDLKLLGGESSVGTNSRTVSYTGKQDLQAEVYVSPPECT